MGFCDGRWTRRSDWPICRRRLWPTTNLETERHRTWPPGSTGSSGTMVRFFRVCCDQKVLVIHRIRLFFVGRGGATREEKSFLPGKFGLVVRTWRRMFSAKNQMRWTWHPLDSVTIKGCPLSLSLSLVCHLSMFVLPFSIFCCTVRWLLSSFFFFLSFCFVFCASYGSWSVACRLSDRRGHGRSSGLQRGAAGDMPGRVRRPQRSRGTDAAPITSRLV